MRPTLGILLVVARLLGVIQVVVGLAMWLGWLPHAVATHTALGSLFVVVLWMVALIALFVLSTRVVPLMALFWGGLVLWLGMAQTTLLIGSAHWTIRVAHIVVGLAALGFIESLVKATRRHWKARAATTASVTLLMVTAPSADAQAPTPRCDEAPRQAITMIDVPGLPFQALPSADGCWVFVSLIRPRPDTVSGIAVLHRSGGALTFARVQPVDANATGMALTHDGRTLVVAAGPRLAFLNVQKLIAGDTSAVLGYLDEPGTSGRVYASITRDDKAVFVADEGSRTITVVDLPRAMSQFGPAAIIGKIPTGDAPIAVTLSSNDSVLFVSSQAAPSELNWPAECKREGAQADTTPVNQQGAIHVVDAMRARTDPSHAVLASVPAGCSVVRLVLSPSGDRVYATARNSNALMVFDATKLRADPAHALIGRVPVGTAPVGIAVIDHGRKIVVTNSNRFAGTADDRQTLTVIDASKVADGQRAVIGSIPAGAFPREMRVTSDGKALVVTNFMSRQIELIDLARLPVEPARP